MIILPLLLQGRRAVCMLMGEQSYHFIGQEIRPCFSLVGQLSVSVENHYLLEQTQRRAAELAEAKESLTKLNADKDKFFSIVAHDLKGPFMPVLGNAELLSEMADLLPPDELKIMGQSIYRSANNTLNLLENLLQWSRLQMGHMEYNPERLNLHEIAEQSVQLLLGNAQDKGIKLYTTISDTVFVYTDPFMLDTVIRNLTSNALKFTLKAGEVRIEATPFDANFIEIAVADTGVGMTKEVQQKLFRFDEPITTLGTAQEKGTGLGLIICQEMVSTGSGKIWVESKVGQGSTFKFTIPQKVILLSDQGMRNCLTLTNSGA